LSGKGTGLLCFASAESETAAARRDSIRSYHNGSVWPRDNAMIALGLARYGFAWHAAKVFSAMVEAAAFQESRRPPKLFCGFIRKPHRGPTVCWVRAASLGIGSAFCVSRGVRTSVMKPIRCHSAIPPCPPL
jgi:glycogen debranching enzyme